MLGLGLLLAAAAASGQQSEPQEEATRDVLGARAAIAPRAFDRPVTTLPAGTVLRSEPDAGAEVLARVAEATEVALLGEKGDWRRVQWRGYRGWYSPHLAVADPAVDPVGSGWAPRVSDPEQRENRWQKARRALPGVEPRVVGSYEVLTDLPVRSDRWRATRKLLGCFGRMYEQRTGVELPKGEAAIQGISELPDSDRLVLFSTEAAYSSYVAGDAQFVGIETGGHAFPGFAALHLEEKIGSSPLALLAHELTHLENARRFGQRLPAWLEEGLAEELAWGVANRGDCSSLGGLPQSSNSVRATRDNGVDIRVTWPAELINLTCALARWPSRRPPLKMLFGLRHEELRTRADRTSLYVAAALTLRYLSTQPPTLGPPANRLQEILASYAAPELAPPQETQTLPDRLEPAALAEDVAVWFTSTYRRVWRSLPPCPR